MLTVKSSYEIQNYILLSSRQSFQPFTPIHPLRRISRYKDSLYQGEMRHYFLLLVGLAAMMGGANAGTAEEFKKTYVDGMDKGLKCQKGFKSVSPRVLKATEECAKHSEITNFDCFLACLYRTYKYVKDGSNDIDYAIADIVTMESFDVTSQDGRDSYWTIALNRYFCGKEYAESGAAFFPTKFDNADDCKKASSFYDCQFNSMFCANDDATSVMSKAAAR